MPLDPQFRALADFLVSIVLREMKNPRHHQISTEGPSSFLDRRNDEHDKYTKANKIDSGKGVGG